MALNKPALKEAIIAAQQAATGCATPELAREVFAEALSTAIDAFVRSGTVNTTGSASAQVGTIT